MKKEEIKLSHVVEKIDCNYNQRKKSGEEILKLGKEICDALPDGFEADVEDNEPKLYNGENTIISIRKEDDGEVVCDSYKPDDDDMVETSYMDDLAIEDEIEVIHFLAKYINSEEYKENFN